MGMLVLGRDPTQVPLDPSDVLSWVCSALPLNPLSLDQEQDCGPHCDKPKGQLVAAGSPTENPSSELPQHQTSSGSATSPCSSQ